MNPCRPSELAEARCGIEAQQKGLDALRLTAAEYQALQGRWAEDAQALENVRGELASTRTEAIKERERREQAESIARQARLEHEVFEEQQAGDQTHRQRRCSQSPGNAAKAPVATRPMASVD